MVLLRWHAASPGWSMAARFAIRVATAPENGCRAQLDESFASWLVVRFVEGRGLVCITTLKTRSIVK